MKGLFILVVLQVITGISIAHEQGEDARFMKWVSEYKMQDVDPAKIYSVWKKNAEFVDYQNSLSLPYTLSLNQFAHLNVQDLPKTPVQMNDESSLFEDAFPPANPIPSSIDWREKGAVLPVKNQGMCGSAATFAIVESISSFGYIVSGQLKSVSIDEYVACCLNGSCNGGIFGLGGYDCIVKLGGLACESDYPWSANHTCMSKEVKPCVIIKGAKAVSPSGDEMALAEALLKQPIAVGIDASHPSFQLYKSGIYNEPSCSKTKLDHAVLLVGYGTMNGEDYWLIQNSWGESWGMNGFMMIARNRGNVCGIATMAVYPY